MWLLNHYIKSQKKPENFICSTSKTAKTQIFLAWTIAFSKLIQNEWFSENKNWLED